MSRDLTAMTIVGRVGTTPQLSAGPNGDRVNFRVVATERRFDQASQKWVDGDEFGVTVVCWRAMAMSVITTIRKGDPVVVVGRIATRRYEKNGVMQYFTEVKADSVGLDVSRVGTRFTRNQMEPRTAEEAQNGGNAPGTDVEGVADQVVPAQPGDLPVESDDADYSDDPWAASQQHGLNGALVTVE